MNIADEIAEYGIALKSKIVQLEQEREQDKQIIQQLQKQLNESKIKKE